MTSKIVVVTGVTRGLGLALSDSLIAKGHQVVGVGRTKKQVDKLSSQYPMHHFTAIDIAGFASVASWAGSVLEQVGVPDIVINNAGLINANAPLWEVPEKEFSSVIDVNIKGTYHLIQQFSPAMMAKGSGVFVNFSSGWGRSVSADVAPYCASKWAVEGLSKALAADFQARNAKGLVSVALNPGVIHTQMLDSCFGEQAAGFIKPDVWAESAVPLILGLGTRDNGASLTVS